MNNMTAWIAAEAERPDVGKDAGFPKRRRADDPAEQRSTERGLPVFPGQQFPAHQFPAHQFPARGAESGASPSPLPAEDAGNGASEDSASESEGNVLQALDESASKVRDQNDEDERVRRVYRGRTVAMLRRYLRYSIETGRLPSLLGSEFFRAQVTAYAVGTFEDRVIFVHDMERCLDRLDAFSRQLIARHILQEHDQVATGRLLHCTERTVRTYIPIALDLLSEILLEVGLMERLESTRRNSCQGG